MLTLVAAVLAYDLVDRASETCERKSGRSEFRLAMSETSEENDMAVLEAQLWKSDYSTAVEATWEARREYCRIEKLLTATFRCCRKVDATRWRVEARIGNRGRRVSVRSL